ncbi:hypothetical protein G6F53_013330 [Rhizopus delemar]|nr:hypothetical protein G6F53_013330 [Rhizopus delemar]
MPPAAQQAGDDFGHGGIVLHQQDAQRRQYRQRRNVTCGSGRLPRPGQRQPHPEARALARRAVHVDAPAHRHRQLLADRKAPPAAAIARGRARAIGLLETVEQALLLLGVDARPAVVHLEATAPAVFVQAYGQADMATLACAAWPSAASAPVPGRAGRPDRTDAGPAPAGRPRCGRGPAHR